MAGPVVGSPFATSTGQFYTPFLRHRGTPDQHRSVWTEPVEGEVACFVEAWEQAWGERDGLLWGNARDDSGLRPLGLNGHREELWFAKFVRASSPAPWHGYPADYRRRKQDRPPTRVLVQWREAGIITKHEAARIAGGRRCNF